MYKWLRVKQDNEDDIPQGGRLILYSNPQMGSPQATPGAAALMDAHAADHVQATTPLCLRPCWRLGGCILEP